MSGLLKGGWHPKGKDGESAESWRGDNKGINQVAGWLGKGKDSNSTEAAKDHVSRPLSSLKDPSAFGPPPKNVNYHGGAALPNKITPDRRGMGAPLSADQLRSNKAKREEEEEARLEEEEARRAPPVPYRADTTGLSTTNLPPPPGRIDSADGRSSDIAAKPKPGLPPRLPPRQKSSPSLSATPAPHTYGTTTPEPAAHKGILNQGSLKRLGASGISVPGFGIGSKPALPPHTSTKPASPGRTSSNVPQLNELQSRFTRLSTSSPATETPAEGTTFAQKQAALRTASSFRNDPSSLSLSDARSAASTANNFRERHGEQVATGWKSANKLNQKYGVADNIGSYIGSPQHSEAPATSQPIEMRDNSIPFKKPPPPPPPPKKKPGLAGADAGAGLPPPLPLASKPAPYKTSSHPEQRDLDLDLPSLWFAKTPPAFPPPSIARLPGSRGYASSSGWSSTGVRKTYTFTGVIRHNSNLATTKFHLTWDGSNPGLTVKAQQKHNPPPRPLSAQELENYKAKYSNSLASWCESQMGRQVGNGECWTLAADGLSAVATDCRNEGLEPCMTSQGVVHGYEVFSFFPPTSSEPPGGIEASSVARGDVIQFLSCHFKQKDGRGQSWAGAPDHTSVVIGVNRGGVLRVVEQNVGGVKRVQEGKYDFSELVAGEVRIFRAVGESWVGKLEPSWP